MVEQTFSLGGPGFVVDQHVKVYVGTALVELWPVIRNTGQQPLRVERIDSFSLDLSPGEDRLLSYNGNWGCEFELQTTPLSEPVLLESRTGRSSKGNHPWFALERAGVGVLSAAVDWSALAPHSRSRPRRWRVRSSFWTPTRIWPPGRPWT